MIRGLIENIQSEQHWVRTGHLPAHVMWNQPQMNWSDTRQTALAAMHWRPVGEISGIT